MISIALVSRHENDRVQMSDLLAQQDDFRIISTGKDGYDALQSAMKLRPNIIIMDFIMEDIESLELAPIIKRNSPATSLIVLCSPDDEKAAAQEALSAGISGCLLRQEGFGSLAASVRSVFHGGLYFKEIKAAAPREAALPAGVSRHSFSPTEMGIFYGITCGHSDREIARSLNMRIGSLRNCISRLKKKTGLQNRTRISVYALLTGILNIGKIKDTFL